MTKKSIAVLTSGGDSQGMNSAIRAIVRAGILKFSKHKYPHLVNKISQFFKNFFYPTEQLALQCVKVMKASLPAHQTSYTLAGMMYPVYFKLEVP